MGIKLYSIPLPEVVVGLVCLAVILVTGKVYLNKTSIILLSFICVSLFATLLFDQIGFVSVLKLVVPLLFVVTANKYRELLNSHTYLQICKKIILIGIYTQLFIVVGYYVTGESLLIRVVELGNVNRDIGGQVFNVYKTHFANVVRFGGFFPEPSWFSVFYGVFLNLTFFLEKKLNIKAFNWLSHAAIVTTFLLTISFTGIAFLLLAYSYKFSSSSLLMRILLFALSVLLLTVVIYNVPYLLSRIELIVAGEDASFNARITGSFIKAVYVLNDSSYVGAGPNGPLETINLVWGNNTSIQNGYLQALASSGLIGFLLYTMFMHSSFIKNRSFILQLTIVLMISATSFIFSLFHWVISFYIFLIASSVTYEQRHSRRDVF